MTPVLRRSVLILGITFLFLFVQMGAGLVLSNPAFTSVAFAKDNDKDKDKDNDKGKKKGLKHRVDTLEIQSTDLQNQINTIELTPGPQGEQGFPGPQGIQGEQGLPGEPGSNGLDGKDGTNGLNGADGQDGADSTVAGPPGPQGNDGFQGPQGDSGPQGPAGADATNTVPIILSGYCNLDGTAPGYNKYCITNLDFNTATNYLSVATSGDFTALVAGYYRINAWVTSNVASVAHLRLMVNGASRHYGRQWSGNQYTDNNMDLIWPMQAGDIFHIEAYNSGGNSVAYHSGNIIGAHSRVQVSFEGPLQ